MKDYAGTRRIKHLEVIDMLKSGVDGHGADPPLGLGKKCPVSKQHEMFMKMNMPVKADGTVDFNATLLALIRIRLEIDKGENDGWAKRNCDFAKLIILNWPHIDYEYIGDLVGVIVNVDPATGEIKVTHDPTIITVGMIYATYILQRRFQVGQFSFLT